MWVYLIAGGAFFLMQTFAPYAYKPTTVIGSIAADWARQVQTVGVENQILLAKSQKLAERIAELEAQRSDAVGKCSLAGLMGVEWQRLCISATDQYYVPALAQARKQLAQIQDQLRHR